MGTVKYTGPMASFHCPTEATIRSLKVHFSPKQLGSGDPSPENVREIVGWDGVEVEQRGKNLFDASNVTYVSSDAWCNSTTHKITASNGDKTLYVPCLPNSVYTVSKTIGDVLAGGYTTDIPTTGVDLYSYYRDNKARNITITTGDDAKYIAIWFYDKSKSSDKTMTQEDVYRTLQIEYGSTASLIESYRGSTTNYEFGVLGKNKVPWINPDGFTVKKAYNGNSNWSAPWTVPKNANGMKITYSADIDNTNGAASAYLHIWTKDENDNFVDTTISSTLLDIGSSGRLSKTITLNTNRYSYVIFGLTMDNATASHPMVELGSTATTYEPYNPNHTVYGGWVDLITGEVQQEWEQRILNGSETWNTQSPNTTYNRKFLTSFASDGIQSLNIFVNWIRPISTGSDAGMFVDGNLCCRLGWSDKQFYVLNAVEFLDEVVDVASFKEYLSNHNLQVVYPLATSNTYHLSPTALQTFLGQNNVWSNADYVEVEYDLHETQTILARKQFIVANQPHIEQASGAIANFTTDMAAPLKECKVEFTPVQDLNGYDKPWPAGGGKNLFDASQIGTSTSAAFITLQLVADTTYTFSSNKSSGAGGFSVQTTNTDLEAAGAVYDNHPITFTALNDASISIRYYNGSNTSLQNYWYQLEKGSAATSYVPYENVCPISGWNNIITSINRAPLPEEYQEIEYIQSNSEYSYFITDYYPNDSTEFYADISFSYNEAEDYPSTLFSSGDVFRFYKVGYYAWRYIKGSTGVGTSGYTVYRGRIQVKTNGLTLTVIDANQTRNYTKADGGAFQSDKPLLLFATEVNGVIKGRWRSADTSKLYRFTLYENSITVRDYVPCYRKSDNEVGLYDLVNKTFLTHSGEGTFSAGPDIIEGDIAFTAFPSVINLLSSTTITANKTLSAAGEEISENGMSLTNYIKVNEGDTYKLTFTSKEGARTRRIYGYNVNKEPVESLAAASWVTVDTTYSLQATIPAGTEYIRVCYKTADENIFLEGPESSTFYGGYVDLTTGEIWETYHHLSITAADVPKKRSYSQHESSQTSQISWFTENAFKAPNPTLYVAGSTDGFCSHIPFLVNNFAYSPKCQANNTTVDLRIAGLLTIEEFTAWMEDNGPIDVVYPVRTPFVVATLTPTQLKTLRGTNNIWSNSNGNLEIAYWKH